MPTNKALSSTYLFQTAEAVRRGQVAMKEGAVQLVAASKWGDPSDGELNRVDTLIQQLIQEQSEPQYALILAELNLAVCKAVGSPSQEVICSNTVGEAIASLKDPRLTLRRIEVYKSALEIAESSGDQWRAAILNNNLGNAYSELTTGDAHENIRSAISCFEQALIVFTAEKVPYAWASIQNNLGTVYKMKPGGDDQNIRPAIRCWEKALTVFDKAAYPLEWANVHRNLGIAYKDLGTGDPVENLVRAKDHLSSALEIFTAGEHPVLWAEVQNTLGNVFFRLTTGNRAENLTAALTCFRQALTVRTLEAYPVQYAATMVNLGNAWLSLPTGDRAENLQTAVHCYEKALAIYSPQEFPELNGQVHTNLAAAYLYLPAGDRSQNLRRADQDLQIALEAFTPTHYPSQYAWCKSTQGAVYQEMARNHPAYTAQSINFYQAALEVYIEESFPSDFARVMDALGTLFRSRMDGDRAGNLSKAEQYYKAALRVYRRDTYPDEWASTHTNLGDCYLAWPARDQTQALRKAIEYYEAAATIHTRDLFPLDYARVMDGLASAYSLLSDEQTEFQLATHYLQEAWETALSTGSIGDVARIAGNGGSLFWKKRKWALAVEWLLRAIDALDEMWGEHYSPSGRLELQAEYPVLYPRIILSYYQLGKSREAWSCAEQGRSRYFLSLLGKVVTYPPKIPAHVQNMLERLSLLSRDLDSLDAVLGFHNTPQEVLRLIGQQEILRGEQRRIIEGLEDELPEYISLWSGSPQEFSSVQQLLEPG